MEDVKKLLDGDEEIWWQGKPDEFALTEEYHMYKIGSIFIISVSTVFGVIVVLTSLAANSEFLAWGMFGTFLMMGLIGCGVFFDGY
ncbi:MAG: hypothetical protein ACTSYF_09990 [Promethearchaeota archaeon]